MDFRHSVGEKNRIMKDLIAFIAVIKYMVMAHLSTGLSTLGRLLSRQMTQGLLNELK